MNKEEHDTYVEYIKRKDDFYITMYTDNFKKIFPDDNSKFHDRQGNLIPFGLLKLLREDPDYTELKINYLDDLYVQTTWLPNKTSQNLFITIVGDYEKKKFYLKVYSSEQEAIDGHENIIKQIEDGKFSIKNSKHDAYVEFVKLRDADDIAQEDEDIDRYDNSGTKYYDKKGNRISGGLYKALREDAEYTELKKHETKDFRIFTTWAPTDEYRPMFQTRFDDLKNEGTKNRSFYRFYSLEEEAIEGHENIMKHLETNPL